MWFLSQELNYLPRKWDWICEKQTFTCKILKMDSMPVQEKWFTTGYSAKGTSWDPWCKLEE